VYERPLSEVKGKYILYRLETTLSAERVLTYTEFTAWTNCVSKLTKRSTECVSLCRNFDSVIGQCSDSNVKCNVVSCFYNIVESRLVNTVLFCVLMFIFSFFFNFFLILYMLFIARQHTDARYWYSKSVCLSVCPLRSGIIWKRLNISSQFFHHTIAQSL